jgi:hypothetical protein
MFGARYFLGDRQLQEVADDLNGATTLALEMAHARIGDPGWGDPSVAALYTEPEFAELLEAIRTDILPRLEEEIDQSADGYGSDVEPGERSRPANEFVDALVDALEEAFTGDPVVRDQCHEARAHIEASIEQREEDADRPSSEQPLRQICGGRQVLTAASAMSSTTCPTDTDRPAHHALHGRSDGRLI